MPATSTSAEGEARRSARVKAIEAAKPPAPKKKAPAKKAAVTKDEGAAVPAKKGKKRAAEAEVEDEPATKKAKSDDEETPEATEAVKALEIGDVLPDITLKNEKDEEVSVKELAKETGIVFFLFPKADTPGCTKQACGFRDVYDEFPANGYTVYGLSGDAPAALTKWKAKKNLPYSFLSDNGRELIKALGALNGKSTKRSHFIFEKGTGKLVDKKVPVKPEASPTLALEYVKAHKA